MDKIEKRIAELKKEIDHHNWLYYVKNIPKISDEEYDKLFRELIILEEKYPYLRSPDSPTQRIGAPPQKELKTVPHLNPMFSLDGTQKEEEIRNFDRRIREKIGQEKPIYVAELKFDGLSVELIYEDGLLIRGSTRGDGFNGEDITPNVKTILSVPLKLKDERILGQIAIRGEALMTLKDFQELNKRLTEEGKETFANPRNAASGSIRQLDPKITAIRKLSFFAYEIMKAENMEFKRHWEELNLLEKLGFRIDSYRKLCNGIEEAIQFHRNLQKEREKFFCEIDGIVIKIDDLSTYKELGVKTRSPRGAIAYKFEPRKEITEIQDIVVQVGRTGKLTPVALLKPVSVSGVTVSRVTLHNEGEVRKKDIRIGDMVRVQRAGDVIPEVVERIPQKDEKRNELFSMPSKCPICLSQVIEKGAYHFCSGGISCSAQLSKTIQHLASKGAFDIDGLGEKIIDNLVEKGMVRDISDIFVLKKGDFLSLEGFGEKSSQNMIDSIEKSKNITLERFIYGLGIPTVGEHLSKVLAEVFKDIESLMKADMNSLEVVPEVGPKVAESIVVFFSNKKNLEIISKIKELGVKIQSIEKKEKESFFSGKTIVFTGELKSFSRAEAKRIAENMGGRVISKVTLKTNFVVMGDSPGSKFNDAKRLDIKILNEEEFKKIVER